MNIPNLGRDCPVPFENPPRQCRAGMSFAIDEASYLLDPDLRILVAHWLVGPPCSLACLDFLLDTVPFSFDDPAVTHRRVVLYRAVTWRVGASQKHDPRELPCGIDHMNRWA